MEILKTSFGLGQRDRNVCSNLCLLGPYFSAVDLAKHARDLDEAEKTTMAEGGFDTAEFIKFMEQPSANMDDSGYFSVQVSVVLMLTILS